MLFNSRISVRIRFSVLLVSNVFVLLSIVIVTLPHHHRHPETS